MLMASSHSHEEFTKKGRKGRKRGSMGERKGAVEEDPWKGLCRRRQHRQVKFHGSSSPGGIGLALGKERAQKCAPGTGTEFSGGARPGAVRASKKGTAPLVEALASTSLA